MCEEDEVANEENAYKYPFVDSSVEKEVGRQVHQGREMEGDGQDAQQIERNELAFVNVFDGVDEYHDGNGVTHQIGTHNNASEAQIQNNCKRNVVELLLSEEVEQQGCNHDGAYKIEKIVVVEDALA